MSLHPRRVVAAPRVKARAFAALLTLTAAAHANPFASPEPPPPTLPLPPALDDQLPPLPAPDPNAPLPAPIRSPEEVLADILPQLDRPNLAITPEPPAAELPEPVITYRPPLPAPRLLSDPLTLADALAFSPTKQLKDAIDAHDVTLLGVLLSGAPRAIIRIAGTPHVIRQGHELPGGEARLASVDAGGVTITYLGESLRLTLGDAQ